MGIDCLTLFLMSVLLIIMIMIMRPELFYDVKQYFELTDERIDDYLG
jgi:hypothetical protein